MRVLYVHGFGSFKGGNTVEWMKKYFTDDTVFSFDIPVRPNEAIEFIKKKCVELDINTIVGTSLGGFYTMQIAGVQKVLINPAMVGTETIAKLGMGEHEFFGPRDDGKTTFMVDETFMDELRVQYEKFKEVLDEEMIAETYAIFGTEDELCPYADLFKATYRETHMVTAKFGHRMTEDVFKKEFMELYTKVRKDFDTRKW